MRPVRWLVCGALAASLCGCSAVIDVSDYAFDQSPCGPRPAACTGGRDVVLVIRALDIPPVNASGSRDGFDLDGTSDPICDHADFTSPRGEPGVDNQLAELLEVLEMIGGTNTYLDSARTSISGEPVALLVISHVDDLANDDCVEVTQHTGYLPAGVTAADLDRDMDGLLDADLSFDYGAGREHDPVACSIGGVVHARFPPTTRPSPIGEGEVTADRGRVRLDTTSGPVQRGLIGGSLRVSTLPMLDATQMGVLRQRADLDPTSREADDCDSISFALMAEVVPARLGAQRDDP